MSDQKFPAQVTPLRSYRCAYHPQDKQGWPVASESGVLPFVQLKAPTAEAAQRAAHHVTGCAVVSVERQEAAEVVA